MDSENRFGSQDFQTFKQKGGQNITTGIIRGTESPVSYHGSLPNVSHRPLGGAGLTSPLGPHALQGRFTIAAKHHISIAEIYEAELVDIEKVRQHPSLSMTLNYS